MERKRAVRKEIAKLRGFQVSCFAGSPWKEQLEKAATRASSLATQLEGETVEAGLPLVERGASHKGVYFSHVFLNLRYRVFLGSM